MNILIADDYSIIRDLMNALLKKHTNIYKVYLAEDGEKTIDILKNEEVDLILLDIMMPKKTGFDVLEFMKENGMESIPTIMFSTNEELKIKALAAGAHEFLTKPVKEKKLISTLEKYVELDK